MKVSPSVWPPFEFATAAKLQAMHSQADILHKPDAVIGVLDRAEVANEGVRDTVRLLGAVALAEAQSVSAGEGPVQSEANDILRSLLCDPEHSARAHYAIGIGLAFTRNIRAEDKRMKDAGLAMLVDEKFNGTEEERLALASIIAGETYEEIPDELISKNILPRTSLEKAAASRDLITQSDVEAYMINVARNVALVEDVDTSKAVKVRAAINIVETLVPVLRMFGPWYEKLEQRAWESAWEVIQSNDPEVRADIDRLREHAEDNEPILRNLIDEDFLSGTTATIKASRIKGPGSIELKRHRKGLETVEEVPDVLGFRIETADANELAAVIQNILDKFANKHGRAGGDNYNLELGRYVKSGVELEGDDMYPIVLDIARASRVNAKLGYPAGVKSSQPKESGFQTVHVNLKFTRHGGYKPLNVELQIGTAKMHSDNEAGEAVSAIYKLRPNTPADILEAGRILEAIRARADSYRRGEGILTLNTRLRLLELFPESEPELASLYTIVKGGSARVAVPVGLRRFINLQRIRELLKNEKSTIFTIPAGKVDEPAFISIIRLTDPDWLAKDSDLTEALRLARLWHTKQEGSLRRTGLRHLEGHVLPLTLAYFMDAKARGVEITQRMLAAMLLHDAVEDTPPKITRKKTEAERERRRRIILDKFDQEVLDSVDIQTKPLKGLKDTGDTMDRHQAARLRVLKPERRHPEAFKKAIDRAGSHMGDIMSAISEEAFTRRQIRYWDNSTRYYRRLFNRLAGQHTKVFWSLIEEIFTAALDDIPTEKS